MATEVPYTGAPNVAPQVNPLPQVRIDTPVAAFGGATAGALTHMGEVAEGAGKEIFSRAYAMQEMDQQIKADAASADAVDQMTNRYLEYDKLKGQERVDAFPQYQKDIDKIRTDGASNLDSPYAVQQFNNYTRRNQSTMIWHGGVSARQGMDEALKTSGLNLIDSMGNTLALMSDPAGRDKDSYEAGLVGLANKAAQYVHETTGWDVGTPENNASAHRILSQEIAKSVDAVAKDHPERAQKLLDDMFSRGLLHPLDASRVSGKVESAVDNKFARNTGLDVAKGLKGWDDYTAPDSVAAPALSAGAMTKGTYNSVSAPLQDGTAQVGKYGVSSKLLADKLPTLGLTDERGQPVTTQEQFLNSAAAQEQFRKSVFPDLQKSAGSFKAALKDWYGVDDPVHSAAAMSAMARGAGPQENSTRAQTEAAKALPNKPLVQDNAGEHALRINSTATQAEFVSNKLAEHAVAQMIDGTNSKDGKVPVSLDVAMKDPEFAKAYLNLDQESQNSVQKIINDNNKLGGVRETTSNIAMAEKYKSIAVNRNTTSTPQELEEFANTNLLNLPLTKEQRSQLIPLQAAVVQGQIQNPNMTHALTLAPVQDLMKYAGITKAGNPTEYAKFMSSYHDAIVAYGMGAERSVKNDEELTEIAKGLISKQSVGYIWNGPQPYQGLGEFDPKAKKVGEQAFRMKYGRSAVPGVDDEAVNRMALQTIFQKYGAGSKPVAGERPKIGARIDQ